MFGFLKRQRLKKDVLSFENNLIDILAPHFPDLAENHKHWPLSYVRLHENGEKMFELFHQTKDNAYFEKNRTRLNKHFKINGLELIHKQSKKYRPFQLTIYSNNIHFIHLPFEKNYTKEFDLTSIRVNNLTTEVLNFENPNEKTLKRVLKELTDEQLKLLEIEDSFEIDLNGQFYYTILDMEDGNYIAVDKKGKVYRLIHDHENPARKIATSVQELLITYSGNKKELVRYMAD